MSAFHRAANLTSMEFPPPLSSVAVTLQRPAQQLYSVALVPSLDQLGSRTTQYSKGAHLTPGRENIRFLGELSCLLEQAGVELVLLYSLEAVEGLSEGGERDG